MANTIPFHLGTGNLPPDMEQEAESIYRNRAIAEAIAKQGMTPLGPTQMVGDRAVAHSPFEGIAKIIQARMGSKASEQADRQSQALSGRYAGAVAEALNKFESQSRGGVGQPDPQEVQQSADQGTPAPQTFTQAPDPHGAIKTAYASQLGPVREYGKQQELALRAREQHAADAAARTADKQDNRMSVEELARQAREQRTADQLAHDTRDAALRRELAQVKGGAQGKAPAGYRYTADGNMEAVPGGPADVKKQGVYNADTATLNGSEAALDRLAAQVKLVEDSRLDRTTGVMGMIPNVPGQAGSVAAGRLEALKSQIGFQVLQEMKVLSKNNASGLGQVTEKEHVYLQQQLGNLDKAHGEVEIRRVLGDIRAFTEKAKERIRGAYNVKHPDNPGGPGTPKSPAKPGDVRSAADKILGL